MFGREWDIHALIGGALLAIVGTQVVALGVCAHAYATYFMGEQDRWFDRMRARFKLEHGLLLGGVSRSPASWSGPFIVIDWINRGFGALGRGADGGARRDPDHHWHPDLLLVVPALDPRPAPPQVGRASLLPDSYRAAASTYRAAGVP